MGGIQINTQMRTSMKIIYTIFCLLSFATTSTYAMEKLTLSKTSGKAPLIVKITGPARLMKHAKNKFNKWVGCSFTVSWGDESAKEEPKDFNKPCSAYLEHTYTKPGTYTVSALTFHANPDDSHTKDWSGSATIVVE